MERTNTKTRAVCVHAALFGCCCPHRQTCLLCVLRCCCSSSCCVVVVVLVQLCSATLISSRTNPVLSRVRRVARVSAAYRDEGVAWAEGVHLCSVVAAARWRVDVLLVSQSAQRTPEVVDVLRSLERGRDAGTLPVRVVTDSLFRDVSALPSPTGVGCLVALPPPSRVDASEDVVVLDGVQDAGNVGTVLRCAVAMGVRQVVATAGTAALWSPKVLRAAAGAHFTPALRLCEGSAAADVAMSGLSLVATTSHRGVLLPDAALPSPCHWVFGSEGAGVSPSLLQACKMLVQVPQPGGEESLNVAAAAAICLYETARQRRR